MLIYPAWIVDPKEPTKLVPEVVVTKKTPPMFFAHANDDRVTPLNPAMLYAALKQAMLYAALKQAGVPAELRICEKGGHGYGLRRTELPVTTWPKRCEQWMRSSDLLKRQGS